MDKGKLVVISQSQERRVLSLNLSLLGLNPKQHGFHTFRRSGDSQAFSLNIISGILRPTELGRLAVWEYLNNSLYPTVLTKTIATQLVFMYILSILLSSFNYGCLIIKDLRFNY